MGGGESKSATNKLSKQTSKLSDGSLRTLIALKNERRDLLSEIAGLEKVIRLQAEFSSNKRFKSHVDMEKCKNELNSKRITLMNYTWEHDSDALMRVSTKIDENSTIVAQLLATRTSAQLRQISECLKRKYNKTMIEALDTIFTDSIPSEKYTKILVSYRMTDPVERDVHLLKSYVTGNFLIVKGIIVLVMTRTNEELRQVLAAYHAKVGRSFSDQFRIKCKDSNFSDFILSVLECKCDESNEPFDEETATAKALQLYDAGAGKTFGQYDANIFIRVLANVSVAQFESINKQYENKQLRQDIVKFLPQNFCEAVLARSTDKFHTLAYYLREALKGETSTIATVVDILGCLSHNQCTKLRSVFDQGGGLSLVQTMRSVLSGPLRIALEALVASDGRNNPIGSYKEVGYDDKLCEAAFKEAAIAAKENYKQTAVIEVGEKNLQLKNSRDDIVLPTSLDQFNRMTPAEQAKVSRDADNLILKLKVEVEKIKSEKKYAKRKYIETCGKLAEDMVWIKLLSEYIEALSNHVCMCDCLDIHKEFSNPKKINIDVASKTLIRVLCRRDLMHLQSLIERYPHHAEKSLMSVIRNNGLNEHLQSFLINLLYSVTDKPSTRDPKHIIRGVIEMDVNRIYNFIQKFNSGDKDATEDYLLEIICTRGNLETSEIKMLFSDKFHQSLEEALQPVVERFPVLFSLISKCLQANRDESTRIDPVAAKATAETLMRRRVEIEERFLAEVDGLKQAFNESTRQRRPTLKETTLAAAAAAAAAEAMIQNPTSEVTGDGVEGQTEVRAASRTDLLSEDVQSMLVRAPAVVALLEVESTTELIAAPTSDGTGERGQGTEGKGCEDAPNNVDGDGDGDGDDLTAKGAYAGLTIDSELKASVVDETKSSEESPKTETQPESIPTFVPPPENEARKRSELFEMYLSELGSLNFHQLSLVQKSFDDLARSNGTPKGLAEIIADDLRGTSDGNLMMDALFAWLGDRIMYATRVLHQCVKSGALSPSLAVRIFTRYSLLDSRRLSQCYETNFERSLYADIQIGLEAYPYLLEAVLSFAFVDDMSALIDPRLKAAIAGRNFVGTPRPYKALAIDGTDLKGCGLNSLSVYGTQVGAQASTESSGAAKPVKRRSFFSIYTLGNRVQPDSK